MDFKKAFVSVTVAFLTVIIDIVFNTMYIFPIAVIILLSYYLMVFYEEASLSNREEKEEKPADPALIPGCNVEFFKFVVKKKLKDYENNRFLTGLLTDKVKELSSVKIKYDKFSLQKLIEFYGLRSDLKGTLFARKGFFENQLKEFFDFFDKEKIEYSLKLGFEKDFLCHKFSPVLIEVNFPGIKLTDRQIGIILLGEKYTGKNSSVLKLFSMRKTVEQAGGFFVVFKENGTTVYFGFAGLPTYE